MQTINLITYSKNQQTVEYEDECLETLKCF